jgi:hypothetical protein
MWSAFLQAPVHTVATIEKGLNVAEEKTSTETIEINGDDLVAKVKELAHEGNVRRIIIKNEEGRKLVELPLTVGVVGALLMPALAGIGAMAALVSKCTIEVERVED